MSNRVCFISPNAYPLLINSSCIQSAGGAEIQLVTIGRALAERGYEVHFIVADFGQIKTEIINNITIHNVALRYMGGPNYYLVFDWIKLLQTLLKIKADFYLMKLPRHLLLPIGVFCKMFKKKLIFVCQIDSDVDPEFMKKKENWPAYLLFRVGLTMVHKVIAQNEKQKYGFKQLYNIETEIIKSALTLNEDDKNSGKEYILWVGSNLERKHPELFLKLAKALSGYKFKMIMAPSAQFTEDTKIRKQALEIANLEYLGFVPFKEIGKHFKNAALFVSTSDREGFPNTFLQSWQVGTPVVSLNLDPNGLIKNEGLGKVSNTLEELIKDVDKLMKDKKQRIIIGDKAKQYVTSNHSPEIIVEKYVKVFGSSPN